MMMMMMMICYSSRYKILCLLINRNPVSRSEQKINVHGVNVLY